MERIECVKDFVDDILVWESFNKEHDKQLQEVLQVSQTGFKLNPDKAEINKLCQLPPH